MPRIAFPLRSQQRAPKDAGFTLTELIAGLLVASLLMAGLVDVIRRYARTTDHVRTTTSELRAAVLVDALFEDIERIDPGTLSIQPLAIHATQGGEPVGGQIVVSGSTSELRWSAPRGSRVVRLPRGAHFLLLPWGAVAIFGEGGHPPIAIATPHRELPSDCQFDTVSRECR